MDEAPQRRLATAHLHLRKPAAICNFDSALDRKKEGKKPKAKELQEMSDGFKLLGSGKTNQ